MQDNTYLKDYICYQMMYDFGVDAPLCSFIYITVNGEDWGLYLAVEGIEEAFASRNYGSNYGQIYKPDNMDMNMGQENNNDAAPQMPEGEFQMPEDGEMPAWEGGGFPQPGAENNGEFPIAPDGFSGFGGMPGGFGGQNSSDVALLYTNDEYESYPNIFDNSVFNPNDADKSRLIASIKQLNEGTNLEEVVNIDEVLRYFVVHNFVLNFDSYTGNMLHNYYLYEDNGLLSMIPWDYNLAFGGMIMGGGGSNSTTDAATAAANYPIDTPVSGANMEDRPLLNQLLSNETYLEMYHALFDEFITSCFDSGAFEEMYTNAVALISPYVEKDPTAFCSYEEFTAGQEALNEFCRLRAQSIRKQLTGEIAATSDDQTANNNSGFVDASHIDMNLIGSNSMGGGRGDRGNMATTAETPPQTAENTAEENTPAPPDSSTEPTPDDSSASTTPEGGHPGGENTPQAPPETTAGENGGGIQIGFAPPEDATTSSSSTDTTGTQSGETPANTATPGQNFGGRPQMQSQSTASQPAANNSRYLLLGFSALILAAGLVFAVLYKRH